ncbi:hypothetical protein C8Q74DRAFT_1373506 [Fomes fomentarius]|nr:hypothetical protein C8Q74DRAFT_1373506 [Fomes fomentarius]
MSALLNSVANLAKKRPSLSELVVQTLMNRTPVKLEGLRHTQSREERNTADAYTSVSPSRGGIRSVLIALEHIRMTPQAQPSHQQIQAALANQATRIEEAAAAEKPRKAAAAETTRKRQTSATPIVDAQDGRLQCRSDRPLAPARTKLRFVHDGKRRVASPHVLRRRACSSARSWTRLRPSLRALTAASGRSPAGAWRAVFMLAISIVLAATFVYLALGVGSQEAIWRLSASILSSYTAFVGTTLFAYLYAFAPECYIAPGETACTGAVAVDVLD